MTAVAFNTVAHQLPAITAGAVGEDCTHLSFHTAANGGDFLGAFEIDTDPAALALAERLEIPAGRIRLLSVPPGADQVAGVRVTAGGDSYASAPDVTFTGGGGGSGAAGVAVLEGDAVAYVRITDPGKDYASAPDVAFSGGGGGSGAVGTALLSVAGTEAMALRAVRGMIAGGVWVQGHTGAPGANGTDNLLTDVDRVQIAEAAFTVQTI